MSLMRGGQNIFFYDSSRVVYDRIFYIYVENYLKLNIHLKISCLVWENPKKHHTVLKLIFYLSLNHSLI